MKSLLLITAIVLIAPQILKAQGPGVGDSKAKVREMLKSHPEDKLSAGARVDTINSPGGVQDIFFYRNDICYSSKMTIPIMFLEPMKSRFNDKTIFRRINDSVWVNIKGTKRVEIINANDKTHIVVRNSIIDHN